MPALLQVVLFSFIISLITVPIVARFALKLRWVDVPGGIKQHHAPTPYGGGLAIAFATLVPLYWHYGADASFSFRMITAGSIIILFGGIWDDLSPLGVVGKFGLQISGSLALLAAGIHLDIKVLPEWLNIALSLIWLVGMTNAMNLLDIMDGLAGGVAGIAAFTIGAIGFIFGNFPLAILTWSLGASLLGFLAYNLPPARIFMGDAGAQFIGFLLAAAAIEGAYTTFNSIALLAPVLILGLPIYDTVLVTFHRMKKGKSPFAGSPDHIAIRLCLMGFSRPTAVRICYGITAVFATAAAAATLVGIRWALTIYGAVLVAVAVFAIWVSRVKVH